MYIYMNDNEDEVNVKVNELITKLNELVDNDEMKMYKDDLYE